MDSLPSGPLPPDLNPRPKKKRRPALSCVTCRDRKLKCDKERPRCGRCVQTSPDQPCIYLETHSRAASQAYQQRVAPDESQPSAYNHSAPARSIRQFDELPRSTRSPLGATRSLLPANGSPRIGTPPDLESRLARLEKILVQAVNQSVIPNPYDDSPATSPAQDPAPNDPAPNDPAPIIPELPPAHRLDDEDAVVYPGSYRGYGLTHPAMLFTEMPSFMARIRFEHPERMIKLKRRIEMWRASNMDSRDIWNDACGFASVIASLPPKESLDWLVFAYFDSFELEYPILDEQKFINAYEAAWDGSRFSPTPHLLMTLLLIIATTVNIYTSQLVEPSPILENAKTGVRRYIHLSERWLLSRGTQVPDLDAVRLGCLLVLAKRYNGFARDQIWTTAGTLVRISMLAGLHAQAWRPGPEQELCRSLWTTILELDLLTAVDSGMVPAIPVSEYSRLANAADNRYTQSGVHMSIAPPHSEMARSLGLRVEICCMLNSNSPEITGQRTAEQERQLKQHLSSIVALPQDAVGTSSSSDRHAHWVELSRAKLRKYLLMIYLPFALQGPLQQQFPHYKKACAEVAIDILSEHSALLEQGNLSVCLKVDDVFQAALTVCNEINQPIKPGVPALSQLPGYVALIKPLLKSALKVLTQRLLYVGQWHTEYLLLCLAIGLVKSKTWPHNVSEYARDVVNQVEESCTFITTPKTPSVHSPENNQIHGRQQSLATPAHSTPHVSHPETTPLDTSAATDRDLFTGLDTVSDSFQDIIEFLGLANPLDPNDPYTNVVPF
ncbi:c6 transcription factor [Diplodia corticola]|uniref:C6 transcription factor n=1 Tax=Diplodia corticola TaxID=236234 RepID=A0A1J9QML4_9PEZI|nr:c6 transcription factor [Diplodia corticola]OJD29721.1 c6 transcription factor [Diplodia corticola]